MNRLQYLKLKITIITVIDATHVFAKLKFFLLNFEHGHIDRVFRN